MITPKKIKIYGLRDLDSMETLKGKLSEQQIFEI
jgi:hypothetical protein